MKIRLLICLFLLISFHGYSQCTLTVTPSQTASSICSGNAVTLTATPSAGIPPYKYNWSNGASTASISVNVAGTYTVHVSDGCTTIQKTFTVGSSTAPAAPTLVKSNGPICPNTSAILKVNTVSGGTYQWYDAAGNFKFTGDTYTTDPITSNTTFYVDVTIGNCTSERTPVNVTVVGKPNVTGAPGVCAGGTATLMAGAGDAYNWYTSATGGASVSTASSITIGPLYTTTTYYVEVTNNGCVSARTPVTATVTQPPAPPTVANTNPHVCAGTSINLHADALAGTFDWFTVPTGGASLISSPDYTTPALTTNTTYYVQTSIGDCVSPRVAVHVMVDAPPMPPTEQTLPPVCYNTKATITATANPSGTYTWYTAPAGGTSIFTGNTYTTPLPLTTSTTYYVQAANGKCSTSRVPITVPVSPQLDAPTVLGAIICSGTQTTLTATSDGGTYAWYTTAVGGAPFYSGDSYTTPALTVNTTYYVQRTFNGCTSPRTPVTVTIGAAPLPPTATGAPVCSGNAAALKANSPFNNYAWYATPTGGTPLSTGQVYVTPALTITTTYYVETSNNNGCSSTRTPVTATVNATPAAPTANDLPVCPGSAAPLTASGAGTIQWFAGPVGGTPLHTGPNYTVPAVTTPITYYVQSTVGTCSSSRTPVNITIIPGYNPQFQYSSGTYCSTSPNPIPVINNPSGGTFSAVPAGLVINPTTGEVNIAASAVGKYTVSFTGGGMCPNITTAKFDIVNTTIATFNYNGPYCQDDKNPLPVYTGGGTPGTFSASPAGIVFANTTTGEIDLSKSSYGTYTVTNTIVASGTCPQALATNTVTINRRVFVDAGPDQTVPAGTAVQLAGKITGGVTTGKWSGGTGTFSNVTDLNATYTPGPGEKIAHLTLTSDDPPGVCGPHTAIVTINFNPTPTAPVAPGTKICAGSTATLSASPVGRTYKWYNAATGGTPIITGPSFTTDPLTVTTTFYVEAVVNGVTSSRTPVTVVVNDIPAPPIISGTMQICKGAKASLTAASGLPGSSYAWYDVAVGGSPIASGSTYAPVLNATTIFYVETKINTCTSTRAAFTVTVTPPPAVTSDLTGSVCSGTALNYTITADQPGATFVWKRAAVPGISNKAANNQTSPTITETLINTTTAAITVNYIITPYSGTCPGIPVAYAVTVYPPLVPNVSNLPTICNNTSPNYTIPGSNYTWTRDAVAGIANAAVTTPQASGAIREVLNNTGNTPIEVTYIIQHAATVACPGISVPITVTVNPTVLVTNSTDAGVACSGEAQDYKITSNVDNATFVWTRSVAGSNPAVPPQTSSTITEVLVNPGPGTLTATYTITPYLNGCPGAPFKHVVSITPPQVTPIAKGPSNVCLGSQIQLFASSTTPNVTYLWTYPDGTTHTDQNPVINNATATDAGPYSVVTLLKGVCQSQSSLPVNVAVGQPVTATAYATNELNPKIICRVGNPTIQLHGSLSTPGTAIWTTSDPDGEGGVFSPSAASLNAVYTFSAYDLAHPGVTFRLTPTDPAQCSADVSDTWQIIFGQVPAVDAGPDQTVCAQDNAVQLTGKSLYKDVIPQWTHPDGTGTFNPDNAFITSYIPSAADIKQGSVHLVLNDISHDAQCVYPTDTVLITFSPPPTLNAGGIRYVLRGHTITLNPVTTGEAIQTYEWSPNIDINDVNAKNPVVTGDVNRYYTLKVTDVLGCTTSDNTLVVVSPEIKINNTFTPNGDGINDLWEITGLVAYTDATVDIFNRYGQKLFHSVGYPKAWDGTYNGQPVPAGVYYYIINTKVNNQVLSGYVTVVR